MFAGGLILDCVSDRSVEMCLGPAGLRKKPNVLGDLRPGDGNPHPAFSEEAESSMPLNARELWFKQLVQRSDGGWSVA